MRSLEQQMQSLKQLRKQIRPTTYQQQVTMQSLGTKASQLQAGMDGFKNFMDASITTYEAVEQFLKKYSNDFGMGTTSSTIGENHSDDTSFVDDLYGATASKVTTMQTTTRFHNSITANKTLVSYAKNGVCFGAFAGFHAFRFQANKKMKYMQSKADLKVGSANISGDAKLLLFQNGKFNPALSMAANVNAVLAEAKGSLRIGNDYINAQGEASVGVGVVRAGAKAVINKEELTLKAEVGAAAVKGKVSGSFSLFGMKITATASGELASVGAGAQFSSKSKEIEFGGKLSFIAGLGFKIKINFK